MWRGWPINKKGIQIIGIQSDLCLSKSLPEDEDCEYCVENKWVEINISGIKKKLIIGVIYRHPKGKIEQFNQEFEKSFSIINNEDKLCFITGGHKHESTSN